MLTRATGAANTVQGVLLGLASAVGIQLVGRAFGPFAAWELVVYPLLGVAGGWLGVALSRGAVERQEALYRATGALYAVDTPRDVAAAVGENLAGPDGERVTLWRVSPGVEDDGGSPSSPSAPGRRRGRGPGPGAAGWTRGGFRLSRACGASRTRWFVRGTSRPPSAARGGRGGCVRRCSCP